MLPGTLEHALDYLVDHELDLTGFDARYRNDRTGAIAYPPAMLLKFVPFAYSRGIAYSRSIVSSRGIERACRDQVTFIALCGDSAPHFTTIADFVSSLDGATAKLFAQVPTLCNRQGLIGREMFAIDGVKLPSNASKGKSGRRADFIKQAAKMEAAAQKMLERHRANDGLPVEPDLAEKATRQIAKLQAEVGKLRSWLADHPQDRPGTRGSASGGMALSIIHIPSCYELLKMNDENRFSSPSAGQRTTVLLTPQEAAAMLQVSPGSLAVWRSVGRHSLSYIRVGGRIRYSLDTIESWLRDRTRATGATA